MFIGILISCSKDDSQFIEINGRYLYEYPNCDNGGNFDLLVTHKRISLFMGIFLIELIIN